MASNQEIRDKLHVRLTKQFDKVKIARYGILHNISTMAYMFEKPIKKFKSLHDAIAYAETDKIINNNQLSKTDLVDMAYDWIDIWEAQKTYEDLYYCAYKLDMDMNLYHFVPLTTKIHLKIQKILHNSADYDIQFATQWNFYSSEKQTSVYTKKSCYCFKFMISLNIFGILYNEEDHKFYLFGIDYDLNRSQTEKNALKSYFLSQMNIFYLVIHNENQLETQLNDFFNRILTNKCSIYGSECLIINTNPGDLDLFYDSYKQMRNLYLKKYARTDKSPQNYEPSNMIRDAPDGYIVSKSVLKKFL